MITTQFMELLFLNLCSVQLLKPRERESHLGTKPAACSAPALLLASLRRGAQVSELEVPWHVGKVDHHWVTDTMRDAWLKQPGMQNEHILVENGDSHIYQTEKFSSKKNTPPVVDGVTTSNCCSSCFLIPLLQGEMHVCFFLTGLTGSLLHGHGYQFFKPETQ